MVKTRFAPSPTGWLHIGGVRTALFSWLFSKSQNGQFILRIDDTDTTRSTKEYSEAIISALKLLGLNHDNEIIYQSSRFDTYIDRIEQLLNNGDAYYDKIQTNEKTKDTDLKVQFSNRLNQEGHVIRFKNQKKSAVKVNDLIHGEIVFEPNSFHDVVILRSNGIPTYNVTSVVDDIDFGITHIIRGDDHLSNAAVQINIFNSFKSPLPIFAHLPMIHGKDGKRLSKRHGAVDIKYFIEEGYLSEAILNYLARTGWSHGDKEIFAIKELLELFTLEKVTKSAAIFDHDKLNWLNQHYIKNKEINEIIIMLSPYLDDLNIKVEDKKYLEKILKLGIEREFSLKKIAESLTYYFVDKVKYDMDVINKFDIKSITPILDKAIEHFSLISFDKKENIAKTMKLICEELNMKFVEVGPIIRFALTGRLKAPSIDDLCFVLGSTNTLKRLNALKSSV